MRRCVAGACLDIYALRVTRFRELLLWVWKRS
jgi:hypothetical protein